MKGIGMGSRGCAAGPNSHDAVDKSKAAHVGEQAGETTMVLPLLRRL
jgi:hypothetical protein